MLPGPALLRLRPDMAEHLGICDEPAAIVGPDRVRLPLTGAAAGILPPLGLAMQSSGMLLPSDIPWAVLGALSLALPLAIAVVSWLVPPRRPELTRRTVIT